MKRKHASGASLALLVALVGCSSDNNVTGIAGDPLTEAEVGALAEVVAGTLFTTFEQTQGALAARARVSGNSSVSTTIECEFGGTVAVVGNLVYDFDPEAETGTFDFTVTQNHHGCMVESEDGIPFTLDGEPNVTADFAVTLGAEGDLALDGGFGGGVAWETGDKSGECPLDVDFSLEGNVTAETGSASVSGSVCGVTFSHELTF